MKTAAIFPYGAGSGYQGRACGPETTKILEKTFALVRTLRGTKCTIYLGDGIDPQNPSAPPLKEIMEKYLVNEFKQGLIKVLGREVPFIMPDIVLAKEEAWGTIAVSIAIAKELEARGITECYLVSSWDHLPRIVYTWYKMRAFSIYLTYVDPRLTKRLLREPIELVRTVFSLGKHIPKFKRKKIAENSSVSLQVVST